MKRTKKIVSILLTLVMALAMSVPAFADDDPVGGGDTTTPVTATQEGDISGGSITINNAVEGQTYSAYQILYLESYNSAAKAYSYKANSVWEAWLKTQTTYVSFDAQGYVTWVKDADAAAFVKAAQVEAAKMTTTLTTTVKKNETSVTFSSLKLGYYLVDTSLGTLCFLDTTNPNATIKEKNAVPTIEKKVKEDSTSEFGSENTAQIGQTVEFQTTIKAYKGAQNYVVHDVMSKGLTFNSNSISITEKNKEDSLTEDEDYTVIVNSGDLKPITDGCTFEIKFSESYLNEITGIENSPTEIIITYTAVLNDKAAISTDANTNKTKLNYGDIINGKHTGETEPVETKTYTYKFDLVKTNSENQLLKGAEFKLYDSEISQNEIQLINEVSGSYRIATQTEIDDENTATTSIITTTETGVITIKGLDFDSKTVYYLEETKAPDGYNKISGRIPVNKDDNSTMTNQNITARMDVNDSTKWESGGVHVTNYTGTELPETGGIGTTVFYAAGVILALGAAVVLVARRRMRIE